MSEHGGGDKHLREALQRFMVLRTDSPAFVPMFTYAVRDAEAALAVSHVATPDDTDFEPPNDALKAGAELLNTFAQSSIRRSDVVENINGIFNGVLNASSWEECRRRVYGELGPAVREALAQSATLAPQFVPTPQEIAQRDIALTEAAHDLLTACEMEDHNKAIFEGKWKKGSKAWSGDFINNMRTEAMAKLKTLTDPLRPRAATDGSAARVKCDYPRCGKAESRCGVCDYKGG